MGLSGRLLTLADRRHIDRVCLEFEAAWKSPAPPQIEAILEAERWWQGRRSPCRPTPQIEAFLEGIEEPQRSELLRELLLLDLDYRLHCDESPDPEEYRRRFPRHRRVVDAAFRAAAAWPSALASGTKVRYFADYELLEEIGRGGMGVVYKARQISLGRTVAVKMMLAGQLASPDEVERFRREAEVAASLQHPGIVAIHEVGEYEGLHYFSMDYVEGQGLGSLARRTPPSAAGRKLSLGRRQGRGLRSPARRAPSRPEAFQRPGGST